MIVEIKGVQFVNKGAELMLYAILDRVRSAIRDVKFTIAPNLPGCPYENLAALEIYPKLWLQRYRVQWGYLANRFPRKLLQRYGLVTDSEVNVVLDASGFAYGDQWGPGNTMAMARAMRRWKKQGTKVILLPQAFGPFYGRQIRKAFRTVATLADRIYPRDSLSYKYVVDVAGKLPHLKQAPDFTVLLDGEAPPSFDPALHEIAIIPNKRMMDKTSASAASHYIPFLATCIRTFLSAGYKPFFLIHGGEEDEDLAQSALQFLGYELSIVRENNALAIKGIIGTCKAVVSSRYHGLVSALSQRVPAIATGWSHKYQSLLEDYGCSEFLLSPDTPTEQVKHILASFIEDLEQQRERLTEPATRHKQAVAEMWDEVLEVMMR